ncbi:hypothetical protein OS493_038797 [Desmophyllum pertusum]|uniref:Uncharacterized protein n=1 Tax=Desmophyllum pertusum TaxID=174260 RepID=A0A9W9Y744_9CNID|nr:hypothetical protein OS493_038797 [Desmophyllum pertusum]
MDVVINKKLYKKSLMRDSRQLTVSVSCDVDVYGASKRVRFTPELRLKSNLVPRSFVTPSSDTGSKNATTNYKTVIRRNGRRPFADLDYALLGYDILHGNPMATESDPGFTHPIFWADYSEGRQSTDCRYSVPKVYPKPQDQSNGARNFKEDVNERRSPGKLFRDSQHPEEDSPWIRKQRDAASTFMKNVQTTTITVGSAPPSNVDAMTWAASVQSNPVPTRYSLMGIENLFTDQFTRHLSPKVNYDGLKEKLADAAYQYCLVLKSEGKVLFMQI